MKKLKQFTVAFLVLFVCFAFVGCNEVANPSGGDPNGQTKQIAEKFELGKTTLGSVEFENDEEVKISNNNETYEISGTIPAMTDAEKQAFGVDDVTHTVALKLTFDKEKTLSECKIQGNTTKVFSDNKDAENYVGSLTDLLDNESNQDAFCYLVLSANTKEYTITATYTDKTTSVLKLKINATLATATVDQSVD